MNPGDIVLVARADGRLEFYGNFPEVAPKTFTFVGQTFVIAAVSRYVKDASWVAELLTWLDIQMAGWQARQKT